MADIVHEFPIQAPIERVYAAVSTPQGLDRWWTQKSSGTPSKGSEYELGFGPEYAWRAKVTRAESPSVFELEMTSADADWKGTRVGFVLTPRPGGTTVRFQHSGWPEANEHWRISSFCWAMYLRVLRRDLEHGEFVPYEQRLDV